MGDSILTKTAQRAGVMMEISNGRPHGRPDDRLCKGRLLPEVAVPDQASGITVVRGVSYRVGVRQ